MSSIASDVYNNNDEKPKAFMVWMLFDNEFNLVKTSSGMLQVPEGADKPAKTLVKDDITMDQSGYFYAYLVNESSMNVYFDDFQVTHSASSVLEENHYYPFGMLNTQLSTLPTEKPLNLYKYNGKEVQKELNLEWLDYGARFYDAQVGRWHSVDPLAEDYVSLSQFHFSGNNPIKLVDLNGMNYDNYYFDKKGNLIDYLKNDLPDKFFIQDPNGKSEFKGNNYSELSLKSEEGYLSRIIFAEAGGENQISKEAVGDVMRNRVESTRFPNTYEKVAEQKATTTSGKVVYQFSSVSPNDKSNWRYSNPLTTNNQSERTSFANSVSAAIKIFYNGSGITNGALLYYSPKSMVPKYSSPNWNFDILKETTPKGVSADSFKFYKYK